MKTSLEELLDKSEETSTLDFKREINLNSDKGKQEFAKDISAFVNTKGGHIVFGKEDLKDGGKSLVLIRILLTLHKCTRLSQKDVIHQ